MNITEQEQIIVRSTIVPGDLGRIIAMHGELYAREYGFDHRFEAYVAESLATFARRYDPFRDRLWLVELHGAFVGSIGIASQTRESAQLRWFLVSPEVRGTGVGTSLLEQSINFCIEAGFGHMFLWTFHRLMTATKLYTRAGFRLTESMEVSEEWGAPVIEQRYDLWL